MEASNKEVSNIKTNNKEDNAIKASQYAQNISEPQHRLQANIDTGRDATSTMPLPPSITSRSSVSKLVEE
jgi:hypothetical protein